MQLLFLGHYLGMNLSQSSYYRIQVLKKYLKSFWWCKWGLRFTQWLNQRHYIMPLIKHSSIFSNSISFKRIIGRVLKGNTVPVTKAATRDVL